MLFQVSKIEANCKSIGRKPGISCMQLRQALRFAILVLTWTRACLDEGEPLLPGTAHGRQCSGVVPRCLVVSFPKSWLPKRVTLPSLAAWCRCFSDAFVWNQCVQRVINCKLPRLIKTREMAMSGDFATTEKWCACFLAIPVPNACNKIRASHNPIPRPDRCNRNIYLFWTAQKLQSFRLT